MASPRDVFGRLPKLVMVRTATFRRHGLKPACSCSPSTGSKDLAGWEGGALPLMNAAVLQHHGELDFDSERSL